MPFNIPTRRVPDGHDPHTVGRLRDGEKCTQCDSDAEFLRYGRPTCMEHR